MSLRHILRAIFNFAAGKYEDQEGRSLVLENPVKRLSQTRAWYRVQRRPNFIKTHELAGWYQALLSLNNEVMRDYFLLILFTGLRRNEAAQLEKNNVDVVGRKLQISF